MTRFGSPQESDPTFHCSASLLLQHCWNLLNSDSRSATPQPYLPPALPAHGPHLERSSNYEHVASTTNRVVSSVSIHVRTSELQFGTTPVRQDLYAARRQTGTVVKQETQTLRIAGLCSHDNNSECTQLHSRQGASIAR